MVLTDDEETEMTFHENRDMKEETTAAPSPSKKKAIDVNKNELHDYCNKIMDEEYTAFSADDLQITLLKRYNWNFR